MEATTIQKIINEFDTFFKAHKGIKSFRVSPITDFTNEKYPLVWLDVQKINGNYKGGSKMFNFPLYFFSKIPIDYTDTALIKSLSDAEILLDNTYSYFAQNKDKFNFVINADPTTEPVMLEFQDFVAGYLANFQIRTAAFRNETIIPV